MVKRVFKISGAVLLVVFLMLTMAFTHLELRNIPCQSLKVSYASGDHIRVPEAEVKALVKKVDSKLLTETLEQIDCAAIEKAVEKHSAVLKAEAYTLAVKDTGNYKGVLVVKLKHRVPVLRVMGTDGDYYLDGEGKRIPAIPDYATKVPVANGELNEEFARKQLLPFVLFVENDPFWSAQIKQIYVDRSREVFLVPLVGDFLIELGSITGFQGKLARLEVFYKQVLARNSWNKYKLISAKYQNQIIAKRK